MPRPARPHVDPAPLQCVCGADGFTAVSRYDQHSGEPMDFKGTKFTRMIACVACDRVYGRLVGTDHADPEWRLVKVTG